jgi:hypothetical protein
MAEVTCELSGIFPKCSHILQRSQNSSEHILSVSRSVEVAEDGCVCGEAQVSSVQDEKLVQHSGITREYYIVDKDKLTLRS